jgi:hypothetical protein
VKFRCCRSYFMKCVHRFTCRLDDSAWRCA